MNEENYYASRREEMLQGFDRVAELTKPFVAERYGADFAEQLHRDARQEYKAIIPQIPYIRERRGAALNSFLRVTAQEIAAYKAMKKNGKSAAEAWEICHEALQQSVKLVPAIKRWCLRNMMYSAIMRRRLKKLTAQGKQLGFGDFEIKYVPGDGNFDYGIDYVKCGNYNLALALDAKEFAPFVCMSDITLSGVLGWGLTRTETLADGCARCDFRFKRGAPTRISSRTPEVQQTIERIAAREAKGK